MKRLKSVTLYIRILECYNILEFGQVALFILIQCFVRKIRSRYEKQTV